MRRLLKLLLYLVSLAFLAVIAYAYVGPWFGYDFSEPQTEIRKPVELDVN